VFDEHDGRTRLRFGHGAPLQCRSAGDLRGACPVLAAVGIYGVITYAVKQRTHEIGVRTALGTQSGDVLQHAIRQGMFLASGGIAIGLAGTWALTRFLCSLLFDVSPTDTMTFVLLPLILGFVALVLLSIGK